MNLRIAVALFFLVTVCLSSHSQNVQFSEYKLYSHILNYFLKEEKLNGSLIVVPKETKTETDIHTPFYEVAIWTPAVKALFHKFDSVAKIPQTFDSKFDLKRYHVQVAKGSELDSLFADRANLGWTPFLERYPGATAIVTMSRLVISNDGKMGMIYIGISRTENYGAGYLMYFNLDDKNLSLVKHRVWVS